MIHFLGYLKNINLVNDGFKIYRLVENLNIQNYVYVITIKNSIKYLEFYDITKIATDKFIVGMLKISELLSYIETLIVVKYFTYVISHILLKKNHKIKSKLLAI